MTKRHWIRRLLLFIVLILVILAGFKLIEFVALHLVVPPEILDEDSIGYLLADDVGKLKHDRAGWHTE